jgi:hypothetical protein
MLGRLAVGACLLIASSSLASADNPYSAKAYETGCRIISENTRPSDLVLAVQAGQCLGAVRTLGLLNPTFDKSRRYCAPREVVLVEEIQTITKFMDSHPNNMNQDFVVVALAALTEAFPCP